METMGKIWGKYGVGSYFSLFGGKYGVGSYFSLFGIASD
jgi:hypothetical protein